GELVIGKAQDGERTGEAEVARAFEVEAGLDQQSLHGSAHRFASHLERVGREMRIANRAAALKLDRACDRAVGIDAALSPASFETGVVEHLANNEPAGFLGAHLTGYRRQRGQKAGRQYKTTQHYPVLPVLRPYATNFSTFGPILGLTDYARLSSTNPERVYTT